MLEGALCARSLGRHRVFHTQRASGVIPRSGATVFLHTRERRGCPLARAPPCFSCSECAWGTLPFGRHRIFHSSRKSGARARSGAIVFFMLRVRLGHAPARAPPCFSLTEDAWGTPPLGRHRVLHAPNVIGAHSRSGATVFFTYRERLGYPHSRPENLICKT